MPALVAKSYIGLEQVTDPYIVNGKQYVKVRTKKGDIKQVRAYDEIEYRKYNPEVKIIQPARSKRNTLGFGDAGYIWIFKGETYENLTWFHNTECRFARPWGWYLPSDKEMPALMPTNITPIKLEWSQVSENDQLYSEEKLATIIDPILYDAGTAEFVGKLGDRINVEVTCTRAVTSESMYGISTFHVFEDDTGNIYTWTTTAKTLNQGDRYQLKGTIKDYKTYKNKKQNVLSNCRVQPI